VVGILSSRLPQQPQREEGECARNFQFRPVAANLLNCCVSTVFAQQQTLVCGAI